MRRGVFLLFLLSLAVVSAPSLADNTGLPLGSRSSPPQPSIYAYPGTVCPGGSEAYKGPEAKLAAASGAVYCRFMRKVIVISQKNHCPPGTKPHTEPNATPDADVIWCERDDNYKPPLPTTLPPKDAPAAPPPPQ